MAKLHHLMEPASYEIRMETNILLKQGHLFVKIDLQKQYVKEA